MTKDKELVKTLQTVIEQKERKIINLDSEIGRLLSERQQLVKAANLLES